MRTGQFGLYTVTHMIRHPNDNVLYAWAARPYKKPILKLIHICVYVYFDRLSSLRQQSLLIIVILIVCGPYIRMLYYLYIFAMQCKRSACNHLPTLGLPAQCSET